MKSYEEMAQSALARGKAARKQRSKRNIMIVSGVMACSLIIGLVFGLVEKYQSGLVEYPSVMGKTNAEIAGQAFQYISGERLPNVGPQAAPPIPNIQFEYGYIHIVAKAVENLGVYVTLNEYGSTKTKQYNLFRMEVIDPLQSKISGEFYYLLHKTIETDLTKYDALLISMRQLPMNYVLRKGNELTAFEYLFADPGSEPELGNIIAFTDGVFDESLWQDESWNRGNGYRYAKAKLDQEDDDLLVHRGTTLSKALRRRQAQINKLGKKAKSVERYEFRTDAVQQAMDYIKPFENGVFVPKRYSSHYFVYRYINGCPTNEWVVIDTEDGTVTTSDYRFEEADFEDLPNISSYIADLDLTQLTPQHTDPNRKLLIYRSAVGWYEKTENGVYSIVRIAWQYFDADDYYTAYYDETFILLDETGDHIISREDLIDLIGENPNIYRGEYGVAEPLPML